MQSYGVFSIIKHIPSINKSNSFSGWSRWTHPLTVRWIACLISFGVFQQQQQEYSCVNQHYVGIVVALAARSWAVTVLYSLLGLQGTLKLRNVDSSNIVVVKIRTMNVYFMSSKIKGQSREADWCSCDLLYCHTAAKNTISKLDLSVRCFPTFPTLPCVNLSIPKSQCL